MTFDFTAAITKLKAYEAAIPGTLQKLSTGLTTEMSAPWITNLLGKISPALVGEEQAALVALKGEIDKLIASEGTVLPFVEAALTEATVLAPYVQQLIALFTTIAPVAA